jgi:SAM-dependent methyltransferase
MRRAVKRLLLRLGLYGFLWRARGWLRRYAPGTLIQNWKWRRTHDEALPVPPPNLMFEVVHSYSIEGFLRGGSERAEAIATAVAQAGLDMARCGRILDFGCGCGRVVRHWRTLPGEVHGSDLQPALVEWCRRHLPFGRFETNGLEPPLPYGDARFDLVYALSVFTHLPERLQGRWMAELARVLAPGGFLLLTTHGERYAAELDPGEREAFDAGRLVVRESADAGSNVCGAYHPPDFVRGELSAGFEVVDHRPEGAAGNPHQDLWLLRYRG